jgi:GNAT superfamily N-acetyltransferase
MILGNENLEKPLHIVEITRLDDPFLLPWLNLYETSFPPIEKVLVSSHLELLRDKTAGYRENDFLLAALDESGQLSAIARYQQIPDGALAILWYLAAWPAVRNQGIGGKLYDHILDRVNAAGYKALLLEVEIPELAETDELRRLAQRRLGFYRRHGACLLGGIRFLQKVGWHQPAIPMHILVHPLQPVAAGEAFEMARAYYAEAVEQVGSLEWIQ